MAETEFKSLKFILPRAPLVFPRVNEPDFKFKKEGEFSAKVRMKPSDFPKDTLKKLEAMRDEFADEIRAKLKSEKKGAIAKALKTVTILRPETDKDSGEETGFVLINPKLTHSGVSKKTGKPWKRWPSIFDAKGATIRNAKGEALKKVPDVWGGTEAKDAVEAYPYYTPKDNEVGIAFRLNAVQIIKLVSGGGQSAEDYGFGEEEGGYEGDGDFDADSPGDSKTAGDAEDF